jgi:hypothetical protein
MLVLIPAIPAGLAVTVWHGRRMWASARPLAMLLAGTVALAALVVVAITLPFNASTMRYTVDFAPMLVLAASVGWGWSLVQHPSGSTERRVFGAVWMCALGISLVAMLLIVQTPCAQIATCP